MMNIHPYAFQAWFSVETKHGLKTEFVLDNADDLSGREHGLGLLHFLSDMLDAEFANDERSRVDDYSSYGDVSFLLVSTTPDELQRALERCDLVVGEWLMKYNINELGA